MALARRRILALAAGAAAAPFGGACGWGKVYPSRPVRVIVPVAAGGAILTMLADTLIPEAFEHAGKAAGLVTTLGFGLAFALTLLD